MKMVCESEEGSVMAQMSTNGGKTDTFVVSVADALLLWKSLQSSWFVTCRWPSVFFWYPGIRPVPAWHRCHGGAHPFHTKSNPSEVERTKDLCYERCRWYSSVCLMVLCLVWQLASLSLSHDVLFYGVFYIRCSRLERSEEEERRHCLLDRSSRDYGDSGGLGEDQERSHDVSG